MMQSLILEAVNRLTPVWSERSALLILLKNGKQRTGEVAKELRRIDGFSYGTASNALRRLTKKGLARMRYKGVYEPNQLPVVLRMMEILEEREETAAEFG